MRNAASCLAALGAVLIIVLLITGHAPAQALATRGGIARTRPDWEHRWTRIAPSSEARALIEGRAYVHAVLLAAPAASGTATLEILTDPQDPAAKVLEIHGLAGLEEVELDIVVERGLWARGAGAVTVLYKPM